MLIKGIVKYIFALTLLDCEVRDFLFVDDFFCLLLAVSMDWSLSPDVERMLEFLRLSTLEFLVLCLGFEDMEDVTTCFESLEW